MNKSKFNKEYRKWRQFKRALSNSYHGQGDGYYELEISDATRMMWDIYCERCPNSIMYAIENKNGSNSTVTYRELSADLERSTFHAHVLLNMELPNSFKRQLEK